MDRNKMLSGVEIVTRGAAKADFTLPEIGLKDVIPNGSWLEKKQIQSALEARKHLVEKQRIVKSGVLSRADWIEDMKLAEVTHQVGGHWHFFGHRVWNQLYLYPEEALLLMEFNCLQLKFNNITVSLQQAYSLLLQGQVSILEYKVYASLSRIGYKVMRHKIPHLENNGEEINSSMSVDEDSKKDQKITETNGDKNGDKDSIDVDEVEIGEECTTNETIKESETNNQTDETNVEEKIDNGLTESTSEPITIIDDSEKNTQRLIYKQFKTCNTKNMHKYFDKIPELCQKHVITVSVPDSQHLPPNVTFNKGNYIINLEKIKSKSIRPPSTESSVSESVSSSNIPRIRNSSHRETPRSNWNNRFTRHTPFYPMYHPFNLRQPNMNFLPFQLLFQRPFLPNVLNFNQRFQFHPRINPAFFRPNLNRNQYNAHNTPLLSSPPTSSRKRNRDNYKQVHLEAIKRLSIRLKHMYSLNNREPQNIQSLQKLINTYNMRYRSRLRLSEDFEVIEDENIVETIELDDDDASRGKKSRLDNSGYDVNFSKLKQIALKLKELETDNKATGRHRRALSNVIKTFNKSYNAEVYLHHDYTIIDRRHITLDSSSESDCIIDEIPRRSKSKKLRNPFSILLKRSSRDSQDPTSLTTSDPTQPMPSTSALTENANSIDNSKYNELITKTFSKYWLPNENDFGRVEVPPQVFMNARLMDINNESYLFDFIKSQSNNFDNWLAVKKAFRDNLIETTAMLENETNLASNQVFNSLVKPEDCTDSATILNKLKIIETNKDDKSETSLKIDFDVYNRDVDNFKKNDRPTPHFRIVCVDESSSFPSGSAIIGLSKKYEDNVPILFAVVGVGSVSYLQINSADIPVYISKNDVN